MAFTASPPETADGPRGLEWRARPSSPTRETVHARHGAARAAHRPGRGNAAAAAAGSAATADPRTRLRGVPHRPARDRRRTAAGQVRSDTRPRDRRHGGGARRARRALPRRRARRRAVAGLDLWRLRLLPQRPREPVRAGALHRLPARRRLRRIRRRRPALLLRPARAVRRRRSGTAAVRRPDRLPRAAPRPRRATARPVRLRRSRAHRRASGAPPGPRGVRVHAPRRCRGAGLRARTGRRVGGRLRHHAARTAGCGDPVRTGRRAGAGRAGGDRQGRHRGLHRHPHERHSGVRLPPAVGRARAPLGRQPHAPRRRGIPRAGARGAGAHARRNLCAGRGQRSAGAPARRRAAGRGGAEDGARRGPPMLAPTRGRSPPRDIRRAAPACRRRNGCGAAAAPSARW